MFHIVMDQAIRVIKNNQSCLMAQKFSSEGLITQLQLFRTCLTKKDLGQQQKLFYQEAVPVVEQASIGLITLIICFYL